MKISVGICTHNGEKFIAEQVESILNQSMRPDEIILTDDASGDKTVEIAENLLKDSGITYKIVAHKTHQGILKNFSNCLDMCSGDIIFSCDQDDVWMKDKVESFLPYFEKGCNFVYSNACVIDSNRNILEEDFWQCYGIAFDKLSKEEFCKLLLRHCCIAGCNMAFTKELYDQIRPIPYHFLHDGWVAMCAPWYGEIGFVNKPLIEYRRHGKNTSGFQATDSKVAKNESDTIQKSKKNKSLFSNVYRTTLPDTWFGNYHCYIANEIFYERMKEHISSEYAATLIRCNQFLKATLQCLPKHRVKSMFILMHQYLNGNYKMFRGNIKRLIRDLLYLSVNENTQFEHDRDIW